MKKSNVVILTIALIVSIFLLWLWFYLGFNQIDGPLDLVLSIIWWVLIAVVCFAIYKVEQRRRATIRTSFISNDHIYNVETGLIGFDSADSAFDVLEKTLAGLNYGFKSHDSSDEMADVKDLNFNYCVRSKKFKDNGNTWKGEVVVLSNPNEESISFDNADQLRAIIGTN